MPVLLFSKQLIFVFVGYNIGFNIGEAVNLANEDWLPNGLNSVNCKCKQYEPFELNMSAFLLKLLSNEKRKRIHTEKQLKIYERTILDLKEQIRLSSASLIENNVEYDQRKIRLQIASFLQRSKSTLEVNCANIVVTFVKQIINNKNKMYTTYSASCVYCNNDFEVKKAQAKINKNKTICYFYDIRSYERHCINIHKVQPARKKTKYF